MKFEMPDAAYYPGDPTLTDERRVQYRDYYALKYRLCAEAAPKTIAEIGVRCGYSGYAFLRAAQGARYYGFDANNGTHGGAGGEDGSFMAWAKELLSPYDVEYFELDTQAVYRLPVSGIDFFHIDGDHTPKGVMHDLDLAFDTLTNDGVILIDDYTYIDTVREGVDCWLERMAGSVTHRFVESLRGEILIRKKR